MCRRPFIARRPATIIRIHWSWSVQPSDDRALELLAHKISRHRARAGEVKSKVALAAGSVGLAGMGRRGSVLDEFYGLRVSAFVLEYVQSGVPIRDVDESIGGDQDIGSFCREGNFRTWIDQLLGRRRHPVTDFLRCE